MKNKLLIIVVLASLLLPSINFAQAPNLGTAASFVLFTSNGAVKNNGISYKTLLTGNVGTGLGSNTGFGNVDGVMHSLDDTTFKCAANLLIASDFIRDAVKTFDHAVLLGGDTLIAGVYNIPGDATLNGVLTLNGDANSVFIFKITATLSTAANSEIRLINGVKACNVFWRVVGLVDMATGTKMKGTVIAVNAAINMTGVTLEGRALSTTGAVTVEAVKANLPIGCGSSVLTGPTLPDMKSTACYSLFSTSGAIADDGLSMITGDVGTNLGATTGFNPLKVSGIIHTPDTSTAKCANDLIGLYTYLNTLPADITLLYPAELGHNLVLTPHTYLLASAVTLTDTLYLNAQNNANAVFVIRVPGEFKTLASVNVKLINLAQAKNVFWLINGAISLYTYSNFIGTIVSTGAIDLQLGTTLQGRAFTSAGAIASATTTITSIIPGSCGGTVGVNSMYTDKASDIAFYPNPFTNSLIVSSTSASEFNKCELRIYNSIGVLLIDRYITSNTTTLDVTSLPAGVYFYTVMNENGELKSGKIISQQ